MLSRIPENERERWIDGMRPEGKGKFFPKPAVYACEDVLIGEEIEKRAAEGIDNGYGFESLHGIGTVHFQIPPRKDELYVLMGDPGIDAAPKRNAPVIMCWGVPVEFPRKPARLVSFWWGNGNGAISPWVDRLLYLKGIYNPIIAGVDSTGPQKNMAELINVQYLASMGIDEVEYRGILLTPMDFSGSKKSWYLHALRLFIESRLLSWPKNVVGIRSQLTNYDPIRDKKIAQDIVATMSMSAFAIRSYFHVDPEEELSQTQVDEHYAKIASAHREARLSGEGRARRSSR